MEPRRISYTHIEEFRLVVPTLEQNLRFEGLDVNGEAIFNLEKKLDPVCFRGTWKLHGTCVIITCAPDGTIWASSKNRLLSVEEDHYGFAVWVKENQNWLAFLFENLRKTMPVNATLSIYGEFVGQGINNGTGISELPRSLFIFDASFRIGEEEKKYLPLETSQKAFSEVMRKYGSPGVYHILDFGRPDDVMLDFANKEAAADAMSKATEEVAKQCPVAAAFGITGIGEGIVWRADLPDGRIYRIKSKGNFKASLRREKKRLVEVNPVPARNAQEFAERVLGGNRLQQMIEVNCSGHSQMSDIGKCLKWLSEDIEREERDVLALMDDNQKKLAMKTAHRMAQKFFVAECKKFE